MSKKAKILLCALLVLLLAAFAAVHFVLLPEPVEGEKAIVFQVTGHEGTKNFDFRTNAETLGDALMEQKLIDAEEGPYGLYVTAVDGEAAQESQREYWAFSKDGEMLNTGVSDTYIADGEHYEASIQGY